jgi:hypothetical protein
MTVPLKKKGEGTMRLRISVQTRRTVEDIERELDRELQGIRTKLALHNLPSDKTIHQFLP